MSECTNAKQTNKIKSWNKSCLIGAQTIQDQEELIMDVDVPVALARDLVFFASSCCFISQPELPDCRIKNSKIERRYSQPSMLNIYNFISDMFVKMHAYTVIWVARCLR